MAVEENRGRGLNQKRSTRRLLEVDTRAFGGDQCIIRDRGKGTLENII